MIRYVDGNILDADVEAVVNPVNSVGVAGRGLALQFRLAYPDNHKAYVEACRRCEVKPGRLLVFATGRSGNPRYIVNFPTKRHWRQRSKMEDIVAGLCALREEVIRRKIRSVGLPALGCGLGGLRWCDVRERIEAVLGDLDDVDILVFLPR